MTTHGRMEWDEDGRDWPNREASRFVAAAGLRWHVQCAGTGPSALLLHGTGAATHSWRDLLPLLAPHLSVIAPDLPGHGFTGTSERKGFTLPAMARSVAALVGALDSQPVVAVGHSAGAAVLVRMALDGLIAPKLIVSLNGALLPFRGAASQFFSPIARLLAANPLVPRLFTMAASGQSSVERLIADTGSTLDARGIALYRRLLQSPAHVGGALAMMANWDLGILEAELPRLHAPLLLVAGGEDRSIPSDQAFRVRDRVPGARVDYLRGLGHLAHEEQPGRVADVILDAARSAGVLAS